MGIERFFSSINRNFNVVDVINNNSKIECETLLLDFNSIIHTVSAKLIKKINEKDNKNYNNFKIEDLEDILLLEIKEYLKILFKIVKCDLVYISFDGVPTFSKIIEQKKTRFIGDFIEQLLSKYKSKSINFNKGLISPGTLFMDNLVKFLKEQNLHNNILFSDSNEKGEGEFKILDYILKNQLNDIIIYSPDADLIILSMIIWSNIKNITLKILRYDQNTEILNIIYINHLVSYLISYFEEKVKNQIDNYRFIKDLSFIFTVFGNDFLPRIEDININMDFYLVFDAYIINYIDYGYLLNDNLDIVPKSLFKYFSFLNKYEDFLLDRNANLYKYQNFNYVQTVNLYLDLKNKKYNPSMIFYIDYGSKLNINNKYGKLEYYFYNDNKLKDITEYEYKNNFNQKYIQEAKINYQKLIPFDYKSSSKKHLIAMKDLSLREKEYYLINNKLDNYHTLFSPVNNEKNENPKEMVNQYLIGCKWLINYYFKRNNIDETWFYKYHKSPLLSEFIKYFDVKFLNYNFKNVSLNISPLEQVLYITPIRLENIDEFTKILNVTEKQKKIIINFIESNTELFYNLDEIYLSVLQGNLKKDLFDCSSTTFISKCHYYILDDIKPIKRFRINI